MSASQAKQTVRARRLRLPSEFHYRWVWQLRASPEALWEYVANTDRFNKDTNVPAVTILDPQSEMPNHRRRLKMYRLQLGAIKLVPIVWTENPFEWIKPYRFGVFRDYSQGPLRYMRTYTELRPRPDGGTEAIYEVWAAPRNVLWSPAIPFQIGLLSANDFRRAFFRYDKMALEHRPFQIDLTLRRPALAPGARKRLMALGRELDMRGVSPSLTTRLVSLIERGDDLSLLRMRPYALADAWNKPRRQVLEMFLHATRLGMLDSRWELLCPLCRGPKATARTLDAVPQQVHCDVCHIDYTTQFDQSVEIVFTPNPLIRPVAVVDYCVGGPQITPHVLIQQVVRARKGSFVNAPRQVGRYRVRTSELPGWQAVAVDVAGKPDVAFVASGDGWPPGEVILAPEASIAFENRTDADQLFIFERIEWTDQAATAADVTTLQLFRDLFGKETLRNDVQIGINSLTVMFTDLLNSTALYREIGDAPAFGVVMSHFDVIRAAVMEEGGSIVKTNGDAVMAVFRRPIQAIRAAVRAQSALANPPAGGKPLHLKMGMHTGSCIAVTLNERLDYFGSVVNIAARLESKSNGTDIVLSKDIYLDPEVLEYFGRTSEFEVAAFSSTLKGYGDRAFDLWRITPHLNAPAAEPTRPVR